MSVGLSKDAFSVGPITAIADGIYTDSTDGKCHRRPGTCHLDRSGFVRECAKLKLGFALW